MNPISMVMPAAIPPDVLGTLVPAALFGVWSALVVAVVAGLCAVLGMEGRSAGDEDRPLTLVPRRPAPDERAAA